MAIISTGQVNKIQDDKHEKQAKLRRFQGELMSIESDRNRLSRKVEDTNLELRIAQKKWTELGFEIKEKQDMLKKSQSELQFLEEEIRVIKKKINML